MQKVISARNHLEPGQEGQTRGRVTHPPLELRDMLSQVSVGKGCGGEGVTFAGLHHAAQSFVLCREVVRADAGAACTSATQGQGQSRGCYGLQAQGAQGEGAGQGCSPQPHDNMHISTDPTHLKAPDLPQALLYLSPPSVGPSRSSCKCAIKTPCSMRKQHMQLKFLKHPEIYWVYLLPSHLPVLIHSILEVSSVGQDQFLEQAIPHLLISFPNSFLKWIFLMCLITASPAALAPLSSMEPENGWAPGPGEQRQPAGLLARCSLSYLSRICPPGYARAAKEPYLEPSVSCSWSSSLVFLCT